MVSIAPLLAAVAGLLVYVLSGNAKVVEVGRALMWCGLLVTLWVLAGRSVRLF
jgi:hypothetical protein